MQGGSPYGAGTLATGDGSRQPTETELAIARHQARRQFAVMARVCAAKDGDSADGMAQQQCTTCSLARVARNPCLHTCCDLFCRHERGESGAQELHSLHVHLLTLTPCLTCSERPCFMMCAGQDVCRGDQPNSKKVSTCDGLMNPPQQSMLVAQLSLSMHLVVSVLVAYCCHVPAPCDTAER